MSEAWRTIPEFPNYSVSDLGRVQNVDTGRIMSQLVNQRGVVNVGLTKELVQYKRSVALLVSSAFVLRKHHYFDTPIHLDGDNLNNRAENLMWRPKWFAAKYARQFFNDERGFSVPIEEVNTGERFNNSWEAAIKYGLLDRDIFIAVTNRTYVSPSYQVFRVI